MEPDRHALGAHPERADRAEGASEIARRARGTPTRRQPPAAPRARLRPGAGRRRDHLRRWRVAALEQLEVDELGLDEIDRRILHAISHEVQRRAGRHRDRWRRRRARRPTRSWTSTSHSCIQLGFLQRTPRGRIATERAYEHLGLAGKAPTLQGQLLRQSGHVIGGAARAITSIETCLLLECADAATLAEALAGIPARFVVWRISETVVALDPEAADEIVAFLRRAGLTPRVVGA